MGTIINVSLRLKHDRFAPAHFLPYFVCVRHQPKLDDDANFKIQSLMVHVPLEVWGVCHKGRARIWYRACSHCLEKQPFYRLSSIGKLKPVASGDSWSHGVKRSSDCGFLHDGWRLLCMLNAVPHLQSPQNLCPRFAVTKMGSTKTNLHWLNTRVLIK